MAKVVSVHVGKPRDMDVQQAPQDGQPTVWRSGIVKEAVTGRVWLGRLNLAGDGQADLKNHGGPDKAVLGYSAGHYPEWSKQLGQSLPYSGFGENFTIEGMDEETVYIGDLYAVGGAMIQVSQPRQPCWKLSRRWGIGDLDARVRENGKTGWYFRVLQEGEIGLGDELRLLERPCPEWTVASVSAHWKSKTDRAALAALAACPTLAEVWRAMIAEFLKGED